MRIQLDRTAANSQDPQRSATRVKWLLLATALATSSCAELAEQPEVEESAELVSEHSQGLGTHMNTAASETAVTSMTAADATYVMSANTTDSTQFVTFNNNSRQVRRSTSLMGFTRADIFGAVLNSGRLRPPAGWAVLWGDPGATRNNSTANAHRVYITQLAVPDSKFPAAGIIDGPVNPSGLPANFCGAYVGGACIARSSDGGATFSLASADCVRRTSATCPNGTFYDGADMASDTTGRVYAAYNDTQRGFIDVYMATTPTGAFSRVTDTPSSAALHPRIKAGPGGLYLIYPNGSNLVITRYGGGSSFTGTWTAPVTVATGIQVAGSVTVGAKTMRLGPEYGFDIGKNEQNADEIRVTYTKVVNSKKRVMIASCTTGTPITCSHPATWETSSGSGEQWHPAIAFGNRANDGTPVWNLSWYDSRNAGANGTVEIWRGLPARANGLISFASARQELGQVPCPDARGYWGDYDTMASGPFGAFFRGFSDSSHGACTSAQYTSSPLYASTSMWFL